MKINNKTINIDIDDFLEFYNIKNEKYKEKLWKCLHELENNEKLIWRFNELRYILFVNDNITEIENLWKINDISLLFDFNVNPFITNLLLISGCIEHRKNMREKDFNQEQINIHKKRVNECFVSDLENRNYEGIRVSQLLWGSYFVRCSLIEIGILQYEYYNETKIYIHIPKQNRLDMNLVKKSIEQSRDYINKHYKTIGYKYYCDSWILSKQLRELVNENTNIYKFYDLFDVLNGDDCNIDILNYVYQIKDISDFTKLEENSSLQKILKAELIKNKKFKLGRGILKDR